MLSYNNSDVVQYLRQYDMFSNSLNLVKSTDEKNMVVKQLTKLEEKIISLTNDLYEEEYYALANKECGLLDEEKNRVTALIELINQRLSYVEKRCNNHYQLTGESVDVHDVLGSSELDDLENRLRIIEKYSKNVKLEKELNEDVKSLTNKIDLASEKININKSLNVELEVTFKQVLDTAFNQLGLYNMVDNKEEIEYAYSETEKSLELAQLNLETAKTSPLNILNDCQEMLDEVTVDYVKYKDQVSTLKLIEMYDREVEGYEELLEKRKEVNEILGSIKNQALLDMIMDTVNKQYNTILMEEQDINTFNDLISEKERKLEALVEIKNENDSEEFQAVLKVLIENEKKRQEKILEEQQKKEEEEKKKKLEIERKKQEEIMKRQKIIEEARKKEMEKRTKQMLEEQQNSVLQPGKKKVSFETIKDSSINALNEQMEELKQEDEIQEVPEIGSREEKYKKPPVVPSKEEIKEEEEKKEDTTFFKNKVDIEKELFDEFNEKKDIEKIEVKDDVFDKIDEKINDNKLPDISIDEYMEKFDDSKVDSVSEFDDLFPSIPM